MTDEPLDLNDALHDAAYAAFDAGNLREASDLFARLIEARPDAPYYHYMRGLVHKYRRDWPTSLEHNLRSIELRDEDAEAPRWNAGIAATALGEWAEARRMWQACGITVPQGDGEIEADFGFTSIRLNAWAGGETIYARRIDVVRAVLTNVPLPDSGYRYADTVLHDGAENGRRPWGDSTVPVFNALQRLQQSDFRTFTAFVRCATKADADALEGATGPGVGHIEDWTNMAHYCMRCSYGVVHRHETETNDWQPERSVGIAAQSRIAAERLLEQWAAGGQDESGVLARLMGTGGRSRVVEAIESRDCPIPEPEDGTVWWRGPDED